MRHLIFSVLLLTSPLVGFSQTQEVPGNFTYQGRIFKSNGIDPVEDSSVLFRIQVRSSDGACLLFEETHTRNMTHSQGLFALIVGEGNNSGSSPLPVRDIFKNNGTLVGANCSYTPTSGDTRRLRISFNDGTGFVTIPLDQTIRSVPYALNSNLLQGLSKDAFLQSKSAGDQTKIDNLILKFQAIIDLANGNSSNYVTTSQIPINNGIIDMTGGGVNVPSVPTNINSAVSKYYSDTTIAGRAVDVSTLSNGQSLVWNSTLSTWKAVTSPSGTVTSVVAGAGLTGGTITTTGSIGLAASGVTAGTFTKLTVDSYGRATAGGVLSSSDIPAIDWSKVSSGKPISLAGYGIIDGVRNAGGIDSLQSGTEASRPSPGTIGKIFFATDTQKIYIDNGSTWAVVSSATGAGGTVTNVTTGAGLTGGSITTSGTIGLAASGVTAGTYPKVTVDSYGRATAGGSLASSDIPALDWSKITTGKPASLLGYGIIDGVRNGGGIDSISSGLDAARPSAGTAGRIYIATDTQKIYNDNGAAWITISSAAGAGGTLTSVTAGTGLSGGTITSVGTLSLANSGVTAGTYSKVTVDAYGRAISGGALQESDIPTISGPGKISASTINSGTMTGTASINITGSIKTTSSVNSTSLILTDSTSGNTITLAAPQNLTTNYNFLFPLGKGTAGQYLATDGSGNMSWNTLPTAIAPADASTVVKGLVLLAGSGSTAAGTVVQANDSRLSDSRAPNGSASGDLSGSYPAPTVSKIQGTSVSALPGVVGQSLVHDGTQWAPNYVNVSQIKNASGLSQFPNNCTSTQTMTYSVMLAQYVCQDISISPANITNMVASSGNASSTQLVLGNDSRLTDSRTPSGSASGDLTGTYPGPTLTATGVSAGTYTKVQVDAKGRVLAGQSLIASDVPSLDWSKITSGKPASLLGYGIIDGVRNGGGIDSLSSGADASRPAAGTAGRIYIATDTQKIYNDNGSSWITISSAAGTGGTLTSLTAGTGLTGGTITSSGTVALATSGVTAGTYTKLTVDAYGRATLGAGLVEADIPAITGAGKISASSINSGTMTGTASINTSGTIKTSSSVSSTSLILTDSVSGNTITLSAPQNLTTNYNFLFPLGKGTAGQYLATDGSGNMSWNSLPAAIATPDATTSVKGLVLLANSASTVAGTVVQANDSRLSDSRAPAGSASGDLSGTYPSPTVAKIQGTQVSATPGVSGQTLVNDGSQWVANFVNASQIKNALGVSQFPNNCTSTQTMTYSVMLAQYVCQDIVISAANITNMVASSGNASSTQLVLGNDSRLTDSRTPSGSASGDLTGTYPGPTLTATGVSAGTYTKVQVDAKGRVLAGSLLAASDLPGHDWSKITSGIPTTLAGHGITDGVKNAGGIPSMQSGIESARPAFGTAGRIYVSIDTLKIFYDTGSAWTTVSSAAGNGGTVTSVAAGSGLTGGTFTTSGTLAVDTGTTANKIVALDSSAKLPAVDGSQLTNLNSLSGQMIVYDATGNSSWTVPANVKKIFVEVWGAGGGGSGGRINGTGATGGGAGAYQSWYLAVTPGASISLKVGAGGAGGSAGVNTANGTDGVDGEASVFNGTSVAGGNGGTTASPGVGGAATVSSTINGMSGGAGSPGGINAVLTGLIFSGLGGQGGASPKGGAGGSGSGTTYSTAAIGVAPGGGGGGGGGAAILVGLGTGSNGGAGGKGRIVIWW